MSVAGEAGARPAKAAGRRPKMHRTSIGALALTASGALRLGVQFAILPILARLVGPAEYGLVSLAMPFVLLANVLADGGMGFALGRRREVTPQLESTCFWLSGSIGLTLALLCCAAAFPLGALLDQPRLPWLLMGLAPMLLMNALTSVSNGRIIREGRFAVFAAGDLMSTVIGASVALVAAANGFGASSLVLQQLALWATKFLWLTWKAGASIRPYFRFGEARPLLGFGLNTIGAMLADFVSRNLDNLIIGGVLGATTLGYYAMAYTIIRIPDMLIVGPLYLYIFTAVSRTAHGGDRQALQQLAVSGVRLCASALIPLFCGLSLIADLAVPVILGPKWLGAVAPLQFLSGAGFAIGMCAIMATTLMGAGRSGLQLRMSLLLAIATISSVTLSVRFGLPTVSACLAIALNLVLALYIHRLTRELGMRRRQLLPAFAPGVVGGAGMAAAVLLARRELDGRMPPGLELVLMIALGGAVYLAILWLFARRRLMADAKAFSRAHADKPTAEAATQTAEHSETAVGLV